MVIIAPLFRASQRLQMIFCRYSARPMTLSNGRKYV